MFSDPPKGEEKVHVFFHGRYFESFSGDVLAVFVTPSALVTPQDMQLVWLAGLNLRIEAE